jgi:tRNA threonylcarbamoyladenosine modification (KEOPS) complex Cgi121 subunit
MSDLGKTIGTTPVRIETTMRLASMRQIHGAVDHIYRGDYECAITLASAAENMLVEPSAPYLRQKIKGLADSEEIKAAGGATGPNDFATWLKHGTFNGIKTEQATIPDEESVAWVLRAISKFNTVYDDLSPQMRSFRQWAKQWLERDKQQRSAQS